MAPTHGLFRSSFHSCIIAIIIDVVLRRLCTLRLEYRQAEEPASDTNPNKNVAWPNQQLQVASFGQFPNLKSSLAAGQPHEAKSALIQVQGCLSTSLYAGLPCCDSFGLSLSRCMVSQRDFVSNRHDRIQSHLVNPEKLSGVVKYILLCDNKLGEVFKSQDSNVTDNSPRD